MNVKLFQARWLRPVAICALLLPGCSDGKPKTWNGLLITVDTTRMDAPSLYGVTSGISPNLDRIAAEGIAYHNARTTVPLTLPAHSSMLTGLYPPRSTVRVNGKKPLPSAAQTLAETAKEAGFETAAFIAAVVLAPEFGLDQGFDTYDLPEREDMETGFYDERSATEVVGRAIRWMETRDESRPFFLWIHLFDPHEPYLSPEQFRIGDNRSMLYLSEVSYADDELGRLFDTMRADGTLDRTFITVLADHGEGLGEKGESTHGDFCNDSTLRIPFVLRYPDGHRAGDVSTEIVSTVDVAPTMAEAMGLSMPNTIDGESLFRREVAPDRGVYFESYGPWFAYTWSPITGWVDASGKYLHSSKPRFFDVGADPAEENDLIGKVDVTPYRNALSRLSIEPSLEGGEDSEIDDSLKQRIAGLGYAGLESDEERELPPLLADTNLPDAMDNMELHSQLMQAYAFLNGGLYPEASAGFEAVLQYDPGNPFVLNHLGTSLIRERRFEDAVGILERLIDVGRQTAGIYFNLGVSLHRLGRMAEAREAFLEASEFSPDDPRILKYLEELGG